MNAECEVDEREYAEKADAPITGTPGSLVLFLIAVSFVMGSLLTSAYYVERANAVRAAITYDGQYIVQRYYAPGWKIIQICASKQEAIAAAKALEIKDYHAPQPIK